MTIILLQDLYDIRKRKQKELDFYKSQLDELHIKMTFIKHEIKLTEKIIKMIEREEIVEINNHIRNSNECD